MTLYSALLILGVIIAPVAKAHADKIKSEEVVVQVYVNNHDDEYIEKIEFDDGTAVGDYNYTVVYIDDKNSKLGMRVSSKLATYYDYAAWITRGGVVSISLDPKDNVRGNWNLANEGWNCLRSSSTGMGGNSNWPSNDQCLF